jgi:hypothetical protein
VISSRLSYTQSTILPLTPQTPAVHNEKHLKEDLKEAREGMNSTPMRGIGPGLSLCGIFLAPDASNSIHPFISSAATGPIPHPSGENPPFWPDRCGKPPSAPPTKGKHFTNWPRANIYPTHRKLTSLVVFINVWRNSALGRRRKREGISSLSRCLGIIRYEITDTL